MPPETSQAPEKEQPDNLPSSIAPLINRGDVWRAGDSLQARERAYPSGHTLLDEHLTHGGWPKGALVELLVDQEGCGEWQLLSPLLAKLSQEHWLILLNPPHQPYAPALHQAGIDLEKLLVVHTHNKKDEVWAFDQALHSDSCAVVIGWSQTLSHKELRRLQLSCSSTQSMAFLYRSKHFAQQASPAHLRLSLQSQSKVTTHAQQLLNIEILKQNAGHAGKHFNLALQTFEQAYALEAAHEQHDIHSVELLNLEHSFNSPFKSEIPKPHPQNKNPERSRAI